MTERRSFGLRAGVVVALAFMFLTVSISLIASTSDLSFYVQSIPEPASLTLFGMGLVALAVLNNRRRRARRLRHVRSVQPGAGLS
jgi:hypothetical protein